MYRIVSLSQVQTKDSKEPFLLRIRKSDTSYTLASAYTGLIIDMDFSVFDDFHYNWYNRGAILYD